VGAEAGTPMPPDDDDDNDEKKNEKSSIDNIVKDKNGNYIEKVNKGATENIRTVSKQEFNNIRKELLKNSITIVRKFRNRIAHNLKVITYRAKGNNLKLKNIKNFLPNQFIGKNDYKNKIGINDLFSMISSITFLLKNETLIFQMFSELKADFNLISLQKMVKKYKKVTNFPQNIEKRFDIILGKEK